MDSLFAFKFTIISFTTETIKIKGTTWDLSGVEHAYEWLLKGVDIALVNFTRDRGMRSPSHPWPCNTSFIHASLEHSYEMKMPAHFRLKHYKYHYTNCNKIALASECITSRAYKLAVKALQTLLLLLLCPPLSSLYVLSH